LKKTLGGVTFHIVIKLTGKILSYSGIRFDGTPYNNYITIRELLSSLLREYVNIDKKFVLKKKEAQWANII